MRRGSVANNWTLIGLIVMVASAALFFIRAPWLIAVAPALLFAAMLGSTIGRHSMLRSRLAAFGRAADAEDFETATRLLGKLEWLMRRPNRMLYFHLYRGSLLAIEDRCAESRAILSAVDPALLEPNSRVARDNDLAWALAHDGDPLEAIALAERAVAACSAMGASALMASSCTSTLGVAELAAGRAAEARETLERSLNVGGSPRALATRAFYLGEALLALGQRDEAAVAYDRAVRAMPDGRYGKRAAAALQTLAAARPYRG